MWKNNLVPISLSDYPGEICSIIFFPGCNFFCGYCHNNHLIEFVKNYEAYYGEILTYLKSQFKRVQAVTITGGEPLLQKKILEFIKELKKIGFKIKIDTNGSNPKALKNLLDQKLIDYCALDLKNSLDDYTYFSKDPKIKTKWLETLACLNVGEIDYEVRTTIIREIFQREAYLTDLKNLKIKKLYLQKFNNTNVHDQNYHNYSTYNSKELEELRIAIKEKNPSIICKLRT